MKKIYRRYIKILLAIFNIILCVFLFLFLMQYREEEQKITRRLIQERNKAGVLEDPDVKEESNKKTDKNQQSEISQEDEKHVIGISYRGDCFCEEEMIETEGIGAYLGAALSNDIDVMEYSMNESGTMSQMKLAGVDLDIVETYLDKHEENGTSELHLTERKIRDLSDEELIRSDEDYLPVLCMGYYGGWGNDPEELCEQQQYILDTYNQTKQYIIVGITPAVYSDSDEYHKVMEEKWDEHYLSLDNVIDENPTDTESKKKIAQLIIEKMIELEYLSEKDLVLS